MDDQLNRNLLGQGRKGSQNYQKKVQQIETQIQVLRNKNNMLQKQSDNDIDDQDIKKQIYNQSQFIEAEINKIKKMLGDFAQQFKEPAAKSKLKEMWKNASKEIQRNKIITQRIVNEAPRQSFLNKQQRLRGSLIANNRKSKGNFDRRNPRQSSEIFKQIRSKNTQETKMASEQILDDSDMVFQNKIVKERNQILNHLQQKNQKINQVMNEIALLVDEQGEHVNMVTENMNQAGENLLSANQELDGAIVQQKKAKGKCCWIAAVLLIACIVVLGIVFITSTGNKNQDNN